MHSRYSYSLGAFGSLLLMSACAVGPDFMHPVLPEGSGYTENLPDKTVATPGVAGAAQSFVPAEPMACQAIVGGNNQSAPEENSNAAASARSACEGWWKLFSSAPLNAYIERAIKENPDLQAAEASLRQAQENVKAGYGGLLPQIDGNAGVTREKFSPAEFGEGVPATPPFTLYNASVSVSYALDVFGGTRREIEALQAQADVERYQREAAYLSLTANVVTAAVQEASLKAQLKATQDIIDIQQHQLDVLKQQFTLGAITKLPVLAQEATLAQAQTSLSPLQKQLSQEHSELAILIGQFPNAKLEDDFDLTTLHLPEELPVSLPSNLVEQRPDIKAAEATLHAASANVGVATANMLPQITLTGSYGAEATHFSNIVSPATNVWNLGGGLVQPLFHGGELLHQRRAAQAAYDKAEAQYRSTVLLAFKNVSDSLRAVEYDAASLAAQANAERTAADSLNLTQVQYKAGAVTYLSLLDAQRAYAQAHIGLVAAQAARFADTAALFQALGGGWWSNPVSRQAAQDLSPAPLMSEEEANKLCTVNQAGPAQPNGSQDEKDGNEGEEQ